MDGETVLKAITDIRESLSRAVCFSTQFFNYAGVHRLWDGTGPTQEFPVLGDFDRQAQENHRSWASTKRTALNSLRVVGYPILDDWWVDISVPQIAFLRVFDTHWSNGEIRNTYWIVGSGDNPIGEKVPAGGNLDVAAGDCLDAGAYEGDIAGVFDDSEVRGWEEILEGVAQVEVRLSEQRLRFLPSKTTKAGRPTSPKVAKRREEVQTRKDKGDKPGKIAADMSVSTDIVKADLKHLKQFKSG